MADETQREPTESERAIEDVQYQVEWATRKLAANMLRIMRGAGEPYSLFDQVSEMARAIESSPEGMTVGHITDAMLTALRDGPAHDGNRGYDWAYNSMESGALRAVAGRLLQQPLQENAGTRELRAAYFDLEKHRQHQHEQLLAERRAAQIKPERIRAVRRPSTKKAAKPVVHKAKAGQGSAGPAPPLLAEDRPVSTAEAMRRRAKELAEAGRS